LPGSRHPDQTELNCQPAAGGAAPTQQFGLGAVPKNRGAERCTAAEQNRQSERQRCVLAMMVKPRLGRFLQESRGAPARLDLGPHGGFEVVFPQVAGPVGTPGVARFVRGGTRGHWRKRRSRSRLQRRRGSR
jgi:hypothetical protein